HADRRADEADLDHHHDEDAEPDGVEAELQDDREEYRDGEEHHGKLLHGGAEQHVDDADGRHHRDRVDLEALDERHEVGRHGGDVDELAEHQGADQDYEEHRGGACAFHERLVERPPAKHAPPQGEHHRG